MYPAAAASSPTGMASMLGFRAMHHRAADISFLVHVRMKAAVFLQVIMVGTRAKLIFSRDQGNHSQRNAYPCQHRHQQLAGGQCIIQSRKPLPGSLIIAEGAFLDAVCQKLSRRFSNCMVDLA